MCGIAGFSNNLVDYTKEHSKWLSILHYMKLTRQQEAFDDEGEALYSQIGFAHTGLSILDQNRGNQPLTKYSFGNAYTIVYSGELYNKGELRDNLSRMGFLFKTLSDAEVILTGYIAFGAQFLNEMNGVFSIAIWDDNKKTLLLARDRFGIKPLFYTKQENTLVFASKINALFQFPGIRPRLDSSGLCEIFGLGPAKTLGNGVFKDIYEVLPGHYMEYMDSRLMDYSYWSLKSAPHFDSYEETVERTSQLLYDSVRKQMISDKPICTFLSGGLDSSLITAICDKELKKQGLSIDTYSFDYTDNSKHFKSSSFQPSQDRPYVDLCVDYFKSKHCYLECNYLELADYLSLSVDARDLPNMGDVESSLLYFCQKVSKENRVALTGECADEIFGGYPWFHDPAAMSTNTFPWSKNMETRKMLLSEDLLSTIDLDGYVQAAYEKSVAETPRLDGESKEEARRREIAYLNLRWFMVTLLDRMERSSMSAGMVARVPFADYRIVEYIWNVPWEMKCPNGVVKGLLRDAGKGLLPEEILYRRKSPYPKTYHPEYEKLLGNRLLEVLSDPNSPILLLVDDKKIKNFLSSPSDYGKPWYGQLMAGPQMIAYLLQINYWLDKYKIELV